jgi:hypothetical protein
MDHINRVLLEFYAPLHGAFGWRRSCSENADLCTKPRTRSNNQILALTHAQAQVQSPQKCQVKLRAHLASAERTAV